MTKRQLFKELNALCIKLDNIYNINNGGCCYVAYVLAKYLEEYKIPFTVREYDFPSHYVVEVSRGCLNRSGFNGYYESYNWDSNSLLKMYREYSWNTRYNVKHNSAVHLKIKAIFNKYGNSRKRLHNEAFG